MPWRSLQRTGRGRHSWPTPWLPPVFRPHPVFVRFVSWLTSPCNPPPLRLPATKGPEVDKGNAVREPDLVLDLVALLLLPGTELIGAQRAILIFVQVAELT